jgi:ankyrin repeat protein
VHIAAAQGYAEVIKLLASQGADLNVRNAKGLTPLAAVATRAGRKSMADLLRSLGASE